MNESSQAGALSRNQSIESLDKVIAQLAVKSDKKDEELAVHIDILSLPWVPFTNREELPNIPGVYFILEDARVIYIGFSRKSILRRWWNHPKQKKITAKKGEIKIAWLECHALLLLPVIESVLIERFGKPELNLKWGDKIVPIRKPKTQCDDTDENIIHKLVGLRGSDWTLVQEVAKQLHLSNDEALMWIVRLGALATPRKYNQMLKRLEKALR